MFETPLKELWIYFSDEETNGHKAQKLHESLSQATYENTETEDCINVDNEVGTGAAVKKIDEFVENHQQSQKEKDDKKKEEGENQQSEKEKDDKEKEEEENQQSEKGKDDKKKEEGENQQSEKEKNDKKKEEGENQHSEKEKNEKKKVEGEQEVNSHLQTFGGVQTEIVNDVPKT